ncbi:MAG: molybdopterin molybdotransferase MoeA [Betaproteobacteria bacterium]|nr:molybdopterin molybdotransferase MoeA [Betaproteobacteria bacterium]
MLISVSKARKLIDESLPSPKQTTLPLNKSNGYVLAAGTEAERDYPPFDRITMDGIAIASTSFTGAGQQMILEGYAQAGKPQAKLKDSSVAIEVATGAPLPRGADTIIPYEEITKQTGKVVLNTKLVHAGQYVHSQGSDCKQGTVVIKKGSMIGPPEIAILSSNGINAVAVFAKPRIAIITTGDELVTNNTKIEPHQLRRSNDVMLQTAIQERGFTNIYCTHLSDDAGLLHAELAEVLKKVDIVLITGGVSKGTYDLIPDVLEKLGVKNIFHGVRQRPGKPMWFGKKGNTLVFGLPGNPVSALTCTLNYVIPVLKKVSGHVELVTEHKTLGEAVDINSPLTVFLPVKANPEDEMISVPHNGSGDFTSLADSCGFIELSGDTDHFYAGERYPFTPWRKPCLF